eukprot:TRINITY_DN5662_c0_g1_i1.p1 TRINITY_DN5662_c0_g1~~TRINITY_DN5662_c0_g1_i1.p1  ORF type:complete len:104 (-),score=1.64 TRINITY_DN5662_c0_g1_i1:13-324(-)
MGVTDFLFFFRYFSNNFIFFVLFYFIFFVQIDMFLVSFIFGGFVVLIFRKVKVTIRNLKSFLKEINQILSLCRKKGQNYGLSTTAGSYKYERGLATPVVHTVK